MKRSRWFTIAIGILAGPYSFAFAALSDLVIDRAPFCTVMADFLNQDSPPHQFLNLVGATTPPRKVVTFRYETENLGILTADRATVIRFDINNNGREDSIANVGNSYAHGLVSHLWIAEDRSIDFESQRPLPLSEVASFAQVGAYGEHGLDGPHILPFEYQGVNYLFLYDDWFWPKGEGGRSVVVAKFSGRRLKSQSQFSPAHDLRSSTHDLDILCNVQIPSSTKPTSNRRLQRTPTSGRR